MPDSLTARQEALQWFVAFRLWQERRQRDDSKRVQSILSAWGMSAR
jgi:hypothetical protein